MPLLSVPAHVHATGTLLPRGFFLALGLIYLVALGLDRLAERLRLPASAESVARRARPCGWGSWGC